MSESLFVAMAERRSMWWWVGREVLMRELDERIERMALSEGMTVAQAWSKFARIVGG